MHRAELIQPAPENSLYSGQCLQVFPHRCLQYFIQILSEYFFAVSVHTHTLYTIINPGTLVEEVTTTFLLNYLQNLHRK